MCLKERNVTFFYCYCLYVLLLQFQFMMVFYRVLKNKGSLDLVPIGLELIFVKNKIKYDKTYHVNKTL